VGLAVHAGKFGLPLHADLVEQYLPRRATQSAVVDRSDRAPDRIAEGKSAQSAKESRRDLGDCAEQRSR
jgi:hypothetical protein